MQSDSAKWNKDSFSEIQHRQLQSNLFWSTSTKLITGNSRRTNFRQLQPLRQMFNCFSANHHFRNSFGHRVDSSNRMARLRKDKVENYRSLMQDAIDTEDITLKSLQSLKIKTPVATSTTRCGNCCLRRFYDIKLGKFSRCAGECYLTK